MTVDLQYIKKTMSEAEQLYSLEEVDKAISVMSRQIAEKFHDKNPILLCVMVGGLYLAGRLQAELHFPLEIDYIHATRYRGLKKGGLLQWLAKPTLSLKNRQVIIIDDVLDGGVTLAEIIAYCEAQEAELVKTVVLADKQVTRHDNGLKSADFSALQVPDRFIFGAGMDFHGYLRNAPGIFAMRDENG